MTPVDAHRLSFDDGFDRGFHDRQFRLQPVA